jgi:hypothetical protein
MHKKELWLKLKAYHFDHLIEPGFWDRLTARFGHDHPSLRAFAGKIARKHGWKNSFALRALDEYKKFIYLGMVSDFEVTPSKIIDTVWHEHLLFSKAYRQFCQEIAGRPLDHHPELVPMEEQTGRYSAQYLDTITLYQKEFGLQPPASIWGDTKFDALQQQPGDYQSKKKKKETDAGVDLYTSATPLYMHFEDAAAADFPEFSGYEAGDGGGAGADGSWGDSTGDSGGDSGGDGGGGCSSGCGGGGD